MSKLEKIAARAHKVRRMKAEDGKLRAFQAGLKLGRMQEKAQLLTATGGMGYGAEYNVPSVEPLAGLVGPAHPHDWAGAAASARSRSATS